MATKKKAEQEEPGAAETPKKAAKVKAPAPPPEPAASPAAAPAPIAAKTEVARVNTPPKKKIPKLAKKGKHRLPRKEKKRAKKRLLAG
jgi:hypothetical protein